MQAVLSAKTTTCNTLPIPFQIQALLNSKLLFPWTKHSGKRKARTYLWCLSTWCSELPWPVSTAVAMLMLFSQWKSADHIHGRLSWQKLLCAANTGGLVSTPQVAASAEPRKRELVCPVSDYHKTKIIPWIYTTLVTPLSGTLASCPKERICRAYRLHSPLALKSYSSNLLR